MKKNIKSLLPVSAISFLLVMSSISCAFNVGGKTFEHESKHAQISFTNGSDFVLKVAGREVEKGEYIITKMNITCKWTGNQPAGRTQPGEFKFEIINLRTLKDENGARWKKV